MRCEYESGISKRESWVTSPNAMFKRMLDNLLSPRP
jgi:hypothetical protein